MVFFNCSANGPAARGTECEKSCNTLDMACVSHLYPNMKGNVHANTDYQWISTTNIWIMWALRWGSNTISAGAEMKLMTVDCEFDLFSRWPQGVSPAVCVHLGWYLTVREAALSQRPVPVFTTASPTSLERPPSWTATPGRWITSTSQCIEL